MKRRAISLETGALLVKTSKKVATSWGQHRVDFLYRIPPANVLRYTRTRNLGEGTLLQSGHEFDIQHAISQHREGLWTLAGLLQSIGSRGDGSLEWHEKWAESENEQAPAKGILVFGSWKAEDRDLEDRIWRLAEQNGYECTSYDEVSTCDECYGVIQMNSQYHGWRPKYVLGDGSITCLGCLKDDPESYLQSLEGDDSTSCVTGIDPEQHGYVPFEFEVKYPSSYDVQYRGASSDPRYEPKRYETGWHTGQNDSPSDVAKVLQSIGVARYLFRISATGQFDAYWGAWVHATEEEKVRYSISERAIPVHGDSLLQHDAEHLYRIVRGAEVLQSFSQHADAVARLEELQPSDWRARSDEWRQDEKE